MKFIFDWMRNNPLLFFGGLFLLLGIVIIIGMQVRKQRETEQCKQFGDDAFEGPSGTCYKCPPGFTPIYRESTEAINKETVTGIPPEKKDLLVLDPLGNPICRKIEESPMKSLRKTTTSAIKLQGGYKEAIITGKNLARAESQGTYMKPIKSLALISQEEICKQKYEKKGVVGTRNWVTYDPLTNSCKVCPDNFYKNPNVNDFNNPNICRSYFGTTYSEIQTKPIELEAFKCPNGLLRDTMSTIQEGPDKDAVICYSCPEGYVRNPDKKVGDPHACQTECKNGSIPDPKSGQCYRCPTGYVRTSSPLGSASACKKSCPPGSIQGDISNDDEGSPETIGNCYRCPEGYIRTDEPISSKKACFIDCPENSFRINGNCFQCPEGYKSNEGAISPDEACYRPCDADGNSRIFEYKENQTCYECPEGYERILNVAPFSNNACKRITRKPAELVSTSRNGRTLPPEEVQQLVSNVKNTLNNPMIPEEQTITEEIVENVGVPLNEAGGNLLRIDPGLEDDLLGELGPNLFKEIQTLGT